MEGYVAAKKILFERVREGSKTIIGMEDSHCRAICMGLMIDRGVESIIPISASARMPGGVYVDNGVLIDDLGNTQNIILNLCNILTLPGQHNWQNTAAAYAAARSIGVEPDIIIDAIKSYGGLAHRQELVQSTDGIFFINDSKATNTEAAAKALTCYENIHWILGGQFKEENLGTIKSVLQRVTRAYLIGHELDELSTCYPLKNGFYSSQIFFFKLTT
jgi:UDP-N-acetylmuramoylalanine--D-glutamate ligase